MKRPFEIIDHTADIGIVAFGDDMREAFANAALALFSLINKPEDVKQDLKQHVELTAGDREALLVRWLNELIFFFDAEHLIFSRFDIGKLTDTELEADCLGEKVDPSRHRLRMGVKAATYHLLRITNDANGYRAQVIFDI